MYGKSKIRVICPFDLQKVKVHTVFSYTIFLVSFGTFHCNVQTKFWMKSTAFPRNSWDQPSSIQLMLNLASSRHQFPNFRNAIRSKRASTVFAVAKCLRTSECAFLQAFLLWLYHKNSVVWVNEWLISLIRIYWYFVSFVVEFLGDHCSTIVLRMVHVCPTRTKVDCS